MKPDLTINEQNPGIDFERIANELMNKYILKVNNSNYRICEIEFYLNSNSHKDNYTHGHELQKTHGKWYFHGSGIDITIGNDNCFGGILLRAVYSLDKNKYVYGPLNILRELFSNIPDVYINEFQFGITTDQDKIITKEKPIKAPRVGLNTDKNNEFKNAFLRFLIMPKEEHADKTKIRDAMLQQGYSEEEAAKIWK